MQATRYAFPLEDVIAPGILKNPLAKRKWTHDNVAHLLYVLREPANNKVPGSKGEEPLPPTIDLNHIRILDAIFEEYDQLVKALRLITMTRLKNYMAEIASKHELCNQVGGTKGCIQIETFEALLRFLKQPALLNLFLCGKAGKEQVATWMLALLDVAVNDDLLKNIVSNFISSRCGIHPGSVYVDDNAFKRIKPLLLKVRENLRDKILQAFHLATGVILHVNKLSEKAEKKMKTDGYHYQQTIQLHGSRRLICHSQKDHTLLPFDDSVASLCQEIANLMIRNGHVNPAVIAALIDSGIKSALNRQQTLAPTSHLSNQRAIMYPQTSMLCDPTPNAAQPTATLSSPDNNCGTSMPYAPTPNLDWLSSPRIDYGN